MNNLNDHKNSLLLTRIQQYEKQLFDYERLNNDLRLKLSEQFEIQYSNSNFTGGKSSKSCHRPYIGNSNAQKSTVDPNTTFGFASMNNIPTSNIEVGRGGYRDSLSTLMQNQQSGGTPASRR